MVKDNYLLVLILSTLFIKELWTMFPADSTERSLFPFSDTKITPQTYIWFLCFYAIQLIIIHTWYVKFPEYRLLFAVWFVFQVLEFIEYMLNYNEAKMWFYVGRHQINLNVINFKYVTIFSLTIRQFLCKM